MLVKKKLVLVLINKNYCTVLLQVKLEPVLNIPAEQQQLSLGGAMLVDQDTLETYNITSQSTIQITT